jgi:DNA-binding PadR family transcriptional regulator
MLDYALLGFLDYRPMTGYELKQNMDGSTAHFWNAKLSQIYITLKALEAKGWVRSSIHAQAERPDKRVYTITAEGKSNLHHWLAEPLKEVTSHKNTLLLKLFFAARTDKETILALLHLQKNLHQGQAEFYRTQSRDLIQGIVQLNPALEKDGMFWETTRRFGELYEEMYLAWLTETIHTLEEKLS